MSGHQPAIRWTAEVCHSTIVSQFQIELVTRFPFFAHRPGEAPVDRIRAELGPGGAVRAEQRLPGSGGVERLVVGDDWAARITAARPPAVQYAVAAASAERLDEIVQHFEEAFPQPSVTESSVSMTFTFDAHPTSRSTTHRVATSPWHAIAGNYPESVRRELEELVRTERPGSDGRLVLLHGPPGTGKSHLLRSLAFEWSSWADAVVISDPEALMSKASYLHEVLGGHPGGDRWMLLIVEDAAELLGETASSRMHPGLAKMLNLADGMLGEVLGLTIAITTNEPLHRIHPAVTRPGRCLANIHIDGFSRDEAMERLGPETTLPPGDRITLAQIMQLERGRSQIIRERTDARSGVYL